MEIQMKNNEPKVAEEKNWRAIGFYLFDKKRKKNAIILTDKNKIEKCINWDCIWKGKKYFPTLEIDKIIFKQKL